MSDEKAASARGPQADPGPGDVVWHRKFGFGIANEWLHDADGVCGLFVEFGPHWGRRAVARGGGFLHQAPQAEDVKALAGGVDMGAGFVSRPDPVALAAGDASPPPAQLAKVLAGWAEAVEYIERGGQDIEDHWDDLRCRASLERELAGVAMARILDADVLSQVHALDRRFIACTVATGLCVWHYGLMFQASGSHVTFLRDWYDGNRYWYYFRWPAEYEAGLHGHNVFTWQREVYGFDFVNMSERQLRERALQWAAQMDESRHKR